MLRPVLALRLHCVFRISRHQQDLRARSYGGQVSRQLASTHFWHHDVAQNEIDSARVSPQEIDRLHDAVTTVITEASAEVARPR